MISKTFTLVLSISFIFIGIFLVWHFLLSIYEVKFNSNQSEKTIKIGAEFELNCVGLNSLGWEITFRDLKCEFAIVEGEDLIDRLPSENNQIRFNAKSDGKIILLVKSEFALNQSRFEYLIEE